MLVKPEDEKFDKSIEVKNEQPENIKATLPTFDSPKLTINLVKKVQFSNILAIVVTSFAKNELRFKDFN